MEQYTQYAGFVKNKNTGEYEKLFTTEISPILAKNRAIERAKERAEYTDVTYDTADVVVKKRPVTVTYGNWENLEDDCEHKVAI